MRNENFNEENMQEHYRRRQNFRVVFGIILVMLGVLHILKMMNILPWFTIHLAWPFILIIVGFLLGLKSGFRNNVWWIMMVVGVAYLTPEFMFRGIPSSHYVWPLIIIAVGLSAILRPRGSFCFRRRLGMNSTVNSNGMMQIDVAFGGKKEVITSKDFKGGNVNVSFGGAEINLTQADFSDAFAGIEVNVSFGGLEIIVPSHWEVRNEIITSFGSVEDKRTIQMPVSSDNKKTLILKGACSFGGVEIKSF